MKLAKAILVLMVGGWLGSTAIAGTNGFYVPTFRSEPGSRAAYWETFTVPVGAPGNGPSFGNDTTSLVTQSQADAFITGTGNIYNMLSLSAFTLSYSGAGPAGLVVLQTRSFGTEIDYASVKLNYNGGSLTASRTETDRVAVGEPGQPGSGFFVSSAWQWDLGALDVNDYTITFNAAEPSLSFDAATLDTQVVPEPSIWALMGTGLLALGTVARRRCRSTCIPPAGRN